MKEIINVKLDSIGWPPEQIYSAKALTSPANMPRVMLMDKKVHLQSL